MTAASVHGMIATGDRAGLPVSRVLSDPAGGVRTSRLCYVSRGFSLHAARRIEAHDRAGLEQLCSYVTRPPLAAGSLEKVVDDKYLFKLKSPWSDGTSYIILRTRTFGETRRHCASSESEHHSVSWDPRTPCQAASESRAGRKHGVFALGGKEGIRLHQVSIDLCGSARSGFSNRCLRMSRLSGKNENHRLYYRPCVSASIFTKRGGRGGSNYDCAGQAAAAN